MIAHENSSTSTSSSFANTSDARKMRGRTPSQASSNVSVLFCSLLLFVVVAVFAAGEKANAATLFFGATSDMESPAVASGASQESAQQQDEIRAVVDVVENPVLQMFATSKENLDRLSETDLISVYRFCTLLPLLEESGQLAKSEQSRAICERLLTMLRPLLAPRKRRQQRREQRQHRHLSPEGNKLEENPSAPETPSERRGVIYAVVPVADE